jgi:hypothetical protein
MICALAKVLKCRFEADDGRRRVRLHVELVGLYGKHRE